MSMKKKLTVVVTAVTLVALIAIGATLAWFTDSKEVTNVVTMGNIKITLEEWVKGADGYSYYPEILAAGAEPIQLFTVLTIPNWGNEVKDLSFTVGITAEAVQSDYFTPDGDGVINGWGALNPAA